MTLDEKSRLTALRKAGRSYTEIADALSISKNTVKNVLPQERSDSRSRESVYRNHPGGHYRTVFVHTAANRSSSPRAGKRKSSALTPAGTAGGTATWISSIGKPSIRTPARPAVPPLPLTATSTGNTATTNAISQIASEARYDQ